MTDEKPAPRVSVIVPVYNAERFLRQTVESVLNQSYEDFELILVDDGSTDGSNALCRTFDDERIVLHRQENSGVSVARNTGLRLARADIIGFLDSDDIWHEDKIFDHVAHFDRVSDLGVSYSACRFISGDGEQMKAGYRPKMNGIRAADVYCRNPISGGSAAFFRRTIFEDIVEPKSGDGFRHYFDVAASAPGISFAEDHQCWLRMALHSDLRFEGIDRELTFYRIHDDGLSAKIDKLERGWQEIDAFVKRVAPGLHDSHSDLANAYQMRYFARRLVALGDRKGAARYLHRSLRYSMKPFVLEPVKSLTTLAAVLSMQVLPDTVLRWLRGGNTAREAS